MCFAAEAFDMTKLLPRFAYDQEIMLKSTCYCRVRKTLEENETLDMICKCFIRTVQQTVVFPLSHRSITNIFEREMR